MAPPEQIQLWENPHFLPKGGIFELFLDDTIPPLELCTSVFGFIFTPDGKVLGTYGEDDHHHDIDIPGGHIEKGENGEQALTREIQEETGIIPDKIMFVGYAKNTVPENIENYPYPKPVSYMLFYVGIVHEQRETNELGCWLSLQDARKNTWVTDHRALFESMYQKSKLLFGYYEPSFLDVYTQQGEMMQEHVSYDRIHRQGLWHKGVHVWVLNSKGEFLIQRRSLKAQTTPGLLESTASGHIESGHTSVDTVIKELQEETGICVTQNEIEYVGTIVDQFEMYNGTLKNNEFDDVYLIRKDIDENTLELSEHEISDLSWFDARDYLEKGIQGDSDIVPRKQEYELLMKHIFTV